MESSGAEPKQDAAQQDAAPQAAAEPRKRFSLLNAVILRQTAEPQPDLTVQVHARQELASTGTSAACPLLTFLVCAQARADSIKLAQRRLSVARAESRGCEQEPVRLQSSSLRGIQRLSSGTP